MLMVEGRFDPDRLIAAVTGEMSGEDFACYMMISTLIFSRGGAVPDEPTRDKLKSILTMHRRRVNTALERLASLGKLTIENEMLMTECCREQLPRLARAAGAGIVVDQSPPAAKPPKKTALPAKTNGTKPHGTPAAAGLDLFGAGTLPVHDSPKGAAAIARRCQREFKEWYAGYPNKKAPDAALRAFVRARQRATVKELTEGRDRYAKEVAGVDRHLIAHPATWLNAGRWRDDPEADDGGDHGRAWA